MLVDWQKGEKYFAQHLVDYDPASNNGNWQWVASTGADSQPYFRIFNPWSQSKEHDPDAEYVKKWIYNLVKDIAENDQDGNYTKQIEARLTEMRNYLETWLPVSIASDLIENICSDARLDTGIKFAALKILHFSDRTTKLIVGM